ncbi:MAG: PH domain-containing protein [Lachnospiraceae bacterium]|nr:PH domain-containing protein [Lachnospiraceae bacterium]
MDKSKLLWTDRKRTLFGLPLSFTVYSFDSERFYLNKGLFTQTSDEVRLYRIMDLSLRQTLGQRIFGVGTIHCDSADKTLGHFEIKSIKKPREVMEQLSSLVETERERKRVTSREYLHDDAMDDDDDDFHGNF